MVLLAMFSRPATRVLRLMKHQVIDEASSSSEDAANNSSNRRGKTIEVWIVVGSSQRRA
jgi:hypothetical protein